MSQNKQENKMEEEQEKLKQQQQQEIKESNLVLEEDDDDFEEFEQEDWDDLPNDEKIDVKQWREEWDDEDLHDDFTQQLRQELKL